MQIIIVSFQFNDEKAMPKLATALMTAHAFDSIDRTL